MERSRSSREPKMEIRTLLCRRTRYDSWESRKSGHASRNHADLNDASLSQDENNGRRISRPRRKSTIQMHSNENKPMGQNNLTKDEDDMNDVEMKSLEDLSGSGSDFSTMDGPQPMEIDEDEQSKLDNLQENELDNSQAKEDDDDGLESDDAYYRIPTPPPNPNPHVSNLEENWDEEY